MGDQIGSNEGWIHGKQDEAFCLLTVARWLLTTRDAVSLFVIAFLIGYTTHASSHGLSVIRPFLGM
jgi:hypothetical protein